MMSPGSTCLVGDANITESLTAWVGDGVGGLDPTIAARADHKVGIVSQTGVKYQVGRNSTRVQTDTNVKPTTEVVQITLKFQICVTILGLIVLQVHFLNFI